MSTSIRSAFCKRGPWLRGVRSFFAGNLDDQSSTWGAMPRDLGSIAAGTIVCRVAILFIHRDTGWTQARDEGHAAD